jgi:hypothetical protein
VRSRERISSPFVALCAALVLVGGSGCASDDDEDDGAADDGGSDDGPGDDGEGSTSCGDPPETTCDRASEICVRRVLGAGVTYACEPLPDGCDAERTCADCAEACEEPADTCADTEEDNLLACTCIECR